MCEVDVDIDFNIIASDQLSECGDAQVEFAESDSEELPGFVEIPDLSVKETDPFCLPCRNDFEDRLTDSNFDASTGPVFLVDEPIEKSGVVEGPTRTDDPIADNFIDSRSFTDAASDIEGSQKTSSDTGKLSALVKPKRRKSVVKKTKSESSGSSSSPVSQQRSLSVSGAGGVSRTPLSGAPRRRSVVSLPVSSDKHKKELKPPVPKAKRVKGRRPSMVKQLRPMNLDTIRESFLRSPHTSPVFEYAIDPTKRCASSYKYKEPSSELLPEAIHVLDSVIADYGSESSFLLKTGGELLGQDECLAVIDAWLEDHSLEDQIQVKFSADCVAPTSLTSNIMTCRLPIAYRKNRMSGVCNHELGTHYMRRVNDEKQVWHKRRKRYKLSDYLLTEEGLACLNTHLLLPDKRMFSAALHYYAAVQANRMSFSELFKDLAKYVDDPDRRWQECLRVKRGFVDTSRPGCFAKDQVYFEGAVKILRMRHSLDFRLLYAGKIALCDVARLKGLADLSNLTLPNILKSQEEYLSHLDVLARVNHVD